MSKCENDTIRRAVSLQKKTAQNTAPIVAGVMDGYGLESGGLGLSGSIAGSLKVPMNDIMEKLNSKKPAVSFAQTANSGCLTSSEKSRLYDYFITLDEYSKTKTIRNTTLGKLYEKLSGDYWCVGRVPKLSSEEFEEFYEKKLNSKKELPWKRFEKGLDELPWKILEKDKNRERREKLYADSEKLLKMGKREEAWTLALNAAGLNKYC